MPRIDPQQLLSCLTPLLAINGGIKSSGEVIRLANLMQKYSKKLVSKCIYIQILKCTETDLLGQFMAANGWNLVHTWLNDSVNSANWPFVQEILEMLLLCPVDSNRLKSNHTPKIVKNLSMNISQNAMITALSKKLVEQWLKIAHQEKQMIEQQHQQQNGLNGSNNNVSENTDSNGLLLSKSESTDVSNENNVKIISENNINGIENNVDEEDSSKKSSESIKYKISNNKDSGLVLSIKRSTSPTHDDQKKSPDSKIKSEHKSKSSSSSSSSDKDKKKSSSSSSHKSSSSSSSKSSHRDKDRSSSSSHKSSSRDKHHSSSSSKSSSSKSSSSSSSSSRDKDKEREIKKRDIEKEQAEKDKETLSFLTPLPSNKLQRIPKRQHSETSESEPSSKNAKTSETVEKKKPSISIENRKGDKPKTVKTLNSQFRDHGLAESPPPPPSRKTLKKPANNTVILPPPTTALTSLSTSSKPLSPPPSKKIHLEKALEPDVPERTGGVKLIKPKPMLVESTGFLDALDASAFMNKKDTKKRKRLPSGNTSNVKKDEPESPKIEAKPLKFYKDTLEENADEDKEKEKISTLSEKRTADIESPTKELDISIDIKNENKGDNDEESKADDSITVKKSTDDSSNTAAAVEEEIDEKRPPGIGTGEDGPPGIIKNPNNPRKRAKRSIKWRSDEELVDIHYFPLEENERVNVTKTFMEQKHMEHIHERNALLGRRQDEQTSWRTLILIDNVPEIQYGSKSLEAKIQAEREKNTLQEVFFDGRSMSDSPQEPDFEVVDLNEPATIPLEDVTGNTDSVTSFRDIAWPAPKGDQPQFVSHGGFGNIFNNITPNITIPPAPAITINPLAGLNLGTLQPHENPALNFMGIIQQATSVAGIAPFMQPPPMIQNNYQSNNSTGNNFNNRPLNNYSTGNSNNNNNNNRNRSGSGSNWVRGNSNQQLRRGMCHQYQRTGFCRNRNSGCPYIHER